MIQTDAWTTAISSLADEVTHIVCSCQDDLVPKLAICGADRTGGVWRGGPEVAECPMCQEVDPLPCPYCGARSAS